MIKIVFVHMPHIHASQYCYFIAHTTIYLREMLYILYAHLDHEKSRLVYSQTWLIQLLLLWLYEIKCGILWLI